MPRRQTETELQKQSGHDGHSVEADALFVNPPRVITRCTRVHRRYSWVFELSHGPVRGWSKLMRIARTPECAAFVRGRNRRHYNRARDPRPSTWLGASVKNIVAMERSPRGAFWAKPESWCWMCRRPGRLRKGDVVLRLDGKPADTLRDLQRLSAESPAFGTVNIIIWRDQREITLVAETPVR